MTTQMMTPTTIYVTPTGNVQVQPGSANTTAAVQDPSVVNTYQSQHSRGLGITLVIIGVMALVCNGVRIALHGSVVSVGHGFWCGLLFVATGSFGIAAANKRRCLIVMFMILTITSAIFAIPMLCLGFSGATSVNCALFNFRNRPCSDEDTLYNVVTEALFCCIAIMAALVSVWGTIICSRAVRCCSNFSNLQTMYTPRYWWNENLNQQVTIISQQQQQHQQPAQVVQYYGSQVMVMNDSSQTYPLSNYPYQHPYQYPYPYQQRLVANTSSQLQPLAYGYASAPNEIEIPSAGGGLPVASAPPAYSETDWKKPAH